MIDVSELIEDEDFCQPNGIKITRSTSSIVNHRVTTNSTEINVQGIITINEENSDDLIDEADRNRESIHIFTYERLKTVGKDKLTGVEYQADIVHFNGNDYIVRYCMDDSQYGFCRSTAVKIEQNKM